MRQFIYGSQSAFLGLEKKARTACVRFKDQELPSGFSCETADIGFEIERESGAAKLFIERGVSYTGENQRLRQWSSQGILEFESFSALKSWIQNELENLFTKAEENNGQSFNQTGIDISTLTDLGSIQDNIQNQSSYLNEDDLFSSISDQIRGQDDTIRKLSNLVTRHCARLQPNRPAVIFSVGPSGVGKTKTAEVLAQALRNLSSQDGYGFLRLDMTEYQEAYRVSQLIGSPQGYIGHGEGSQLIESLAATPRLIVLFDEIEKAHPSILKVLMNAMDAGRLSSSSRQGNGYEVDCRYAIFIFTSNLESKEIVSELETSALFGNWDVENTLCRKRLTNAGIAPEIIGRITTFLVFKPLSTDVKVEILALEIVNIAHEYGTNLTYIDPEIIVDLHSKNSVSQDFGVRPLRFMLDEQLGNVFVDSAKNHGSRPVKLIGLPYNCVLET